MLMASELKITDCLFEPISWFAEGKVKKIQIVVNHRGFGMEGQSQRLNTVTLEEGICSVHLV